MLKTVIRPTADADFDVLLALDQLCFPPGIAYDAQELRWFLTRKSAHAIVLEAAGRIVGLLILDLQPRKRKATMVTLDVHPDHRRQGYAQLLLKKSEEILQEQDTAFYELQVDVENAAAISFYEKHGFKVTRTIKAYYANGHDAYLMVKTLPPASAG